MYVCHKMLSRCMAGVLPPALRLSVIVWRTISHIYIIIYLAYISHISRMLCWLQDDALRCVVCELTCSWCPRRTGVLVPARTAADQLVQIDPITYIPRDGRSSCPVAEVTDQTDDKVSKSAPRRSYSSLHSPPIEIPASLRSLARVR
jgi:hypothetical protein